MIIITHPSGQIGRETLDTQPVDLAELRLLIELPALRTLADRGLSDQDLALVKKLAAATMRSARRGDVLGYLQADRTFHLCLLELAGDPALAEIAQVLLAPAPMRAPRTAEPGHLMAREAREHGELADMLADGMVNGADDLLRQHSRGYQPGEMRPRVTTRRNPAPAREHEMPSDAVPVLAEANLGAFFRHRADVPTPCGAALISSLSQLRRSDDPVVTFAGLPSVCVPGFADGCQIELSNGAEPPFRATNPASPADGPQPVAAPAVGPDHTLATPFLVVSRTGHPSYAGVVTHWWTGRTPSESDAVIADLIVKHLVALVDHERLMAAVARAENRAASLALEAISGRTINLATGIIMHQDRISAADAEDLLQHSARMTGSELYQVAASVVRSGSLGASRATRSRADPDQREDKDEAAAVSTPSKPSASSPIRK